MQVIDPLHLCPECMIIKTPRSRHCSVCNKCVERYDHHCPWINNCVGINNHRNFMIFIAALVIAIVGTFVGTIGELLSIESQELLGKGSLNYEFLPDFMMVNKTVYMVLMWFTLLTTGFFMLPVLLLCYIQTKNFWKNRTTNERFSRKKAPPPKEKNDRIPSMGSEISADSTGSSLLSAIQQLKAAEDILKEHGDPLDFEGKCCTCIRNEYAMCFRTKSPS